MSTPRLYIALVEERVDARYGDVGFVLLGFLQASSPAAAGRKARRIHGLADVPEIVVVPARAWRTER